MELDSATISKIECRRHEALEQASRVNRITRVSVVIPVYNESHRIPSLGRKVEALTQLSMASQHNLRWKIFCADEGSTDGSVELIQKMADLCEVPIEVLHLPQNLAELKTRGSATKEVQMGAALATGFKYAAQDTNSSHILYTDFDDSVPLFQMGNVLPLLLTDTDLVIGSRREVDSINTRPTTLLQPGSIFISCWKELFPELAHFTNDTNGPFHLWKRESVAEAVKWVESFAVYNPAFKTAMLVYAARSGFNIRRHGIIFIDDADGSHFEGNHVDGRLAVWSRIIKQLVPLSQEQLACAQYRGLDQAEIKFLLYQKLNQQQTLGKAA